jgi:hypothetical protein
MIHYSAMAAGLTGQDGHVGSQGPHRNGKRSISEKRKLFCELNAWHTHTHIHTYTQKYTHHRTYICALTWQLVRTTPPCIG